MPKRWTILGALLICELAAAQGSEWRMVREESRLAFVATYERQTAPGEFKKFDTRLRFDPKQPAHGRLHVVVVTTSADMGSAELNEGMGTAEWFDMARFPQAEFLSEDIRQAGEGRYEAHGTLRLKNIERKIVVPFDWQVKNDAATMTGELSLDRSQFGIGTGEWATDEPIGLKVQLAFKVKLNRAW